jgi:hypothetical protein
MSMHHGIDHLNARQQHDITRRDNEWVPPLDDDITVVSSSGPLDRNDTFQFLPASFISGSVYITADIALYSRQPRALAWTLNKTKETKELLPKSACFATCSKFITHGTT